MASAIEQSLTIEGFDDPNYDPMDDDAANWGTCEDPYPTLAKLRAKGPVYEGEYRMVMGMGHDVTRPDRRTFMVLGYDEVASALGTPEIYSNKAYLDNILPTFGQSVTVMDAPEHPRYRRIFQKAFLPNVINRWSETLVQPVIDELIDKFAGRGHADLVEEFTRQYPFEIIYRQLGMPHEHTETFAKLSHSLTHFAVDPSKGREASVKLGRYFAGMIADRRANPKDDLVTLLVEAEVDGERLPDEIIISFLRQLLNAGGDTTYRSTGTMLTALLNNPDQLAALRDDPSLLPGAVEELLRWDGPVGLHFRMTTRDTTLGGVEIPADSLIDVMAMSADRDEKKFPDPDKFDVFRKPSVRHFAFSGGPHICIGQHLARAEMARAVGTLLARLPNLRLDPDKPKPQVQGIWMRMPYHLHVRFDPA